MERAAEWGRGKAELFLCRASAIFNSIDLEEFNDRGRDQLAFPAELNPPKIEREKVRVNCAMQIPFGWRVALGRGAALATSASLLHCQQSDISANPPAQSSPVHSLNRQTGVVMSGTLPVGTIGKPWNGAFNGPVGRPRVQIMGRLFALDRVMLPLKQLVVWGCSWVHLPQWLGVSFTIVAFDWT